MKTKLGLLCLIAYFSVSLAFAANPLLHYQPTTVTLTGIMKVEKFPAPPKKECIGDKEEIYRYLILDHPIDVVPEKSDTDPKNELQKNVTTVQVVKIEDTYADSFIEPNKRMHSNWSNKLTEKHVRVVGNLYSRVVRVVMLANHFEEIKQNDKN
jgi:hypothetical protein